jgi:protein-ribulosamine 3-kinase
MAEGEYASMHALYSVAPDMIPKPLGWGTLEADPNGHFFLCEFVNLADEIPDPSSICKALADLHRRSIAMSPNGMFGFEVTTCNGTFPQDNKWNESWETFFAQQMRGAFEAEQEVHGISEDYQRLLPAFFEKVIPRLLRPLETGENSIKPVLIHGIR